MPLHLVTGRANVGKTGFLYSEVEEASRRGECPIVLLPASQDVWRATAEFAKRGVVGVKVATLDRWIAELWALHGDGRRLVGEATRLHLVSQAVERCDLGATLKSSLYPGFVPLIADIARRFSGRPRAGEPKSARSQIAAVLLAYEELLGDRGMVESAIASIHLSQRLPAQAGPVVLNRFNDLSAAQEALACGASCESKVIIALPWEEGFAATAALSPLVERLAAVATDVTAVPARRDPGALGAIEARLYGSSVTQTVSDQLVFALAAGDEAECALAARLASEAVADGIPPENIAIAFRDASSRLGPLVAALSGAGLPTQIDAAPRLVQTPLGRAFVALVEACQDPTRERLLAWASTPYATTTAEQLWAADSAWRRQALSGRALIAAASKGLGSAGRTLESARDLVAEGLNGRTANGWESLVTNLLAAGSRAGRLEGPNGELDARTHATIVSAIEELVSAGGTTLTVAELLRVLRRATVAMRSSEREGMVQLADAHRIRGRRFDVLILGGMTAAEFAADKEPPLAVRILSELGEPAGTDEALSERLLFYLLASRARKKLVLLRKVTNAAGEPTRASAFWDEVIDVFRDPSADDQPEFPPGARVERMGLAEDLVEVAPSFEAGRALDRVRAEFLAPTVVSRGGLIDARVRSRLAEATEFSVTELEVYADCPYRWFYERALGPRDLDREIGARERGSYAHRLLREFYLVWTQESGNARVAPESIDQALQAFDDVERRLRADPRMRPSSLAEELALSSAGEEARSVVLDDATFLPGYKPIALEFVFGAAAGVPISIGGVGLRGTIDRVERGSAGIVAIDYKSSGDISGHASFGTRHLMQAPVYAAAASQAFGVPVVGGLYRSLRTLKVRGFYLRDAICLDGRGSNADALDAGGVSDVLELAGRLVADAAGRIRSGDITARPTAKSCARCGARAACNEAI